MDGVTLLEVHLLSQMRAAELVRQAYRVLGVSPEGLKVASSEADRIGLLTLGHPMNLYNMLLGEPLLRTSTSHPDPYRRRVDHYLLPLWPDFVFAVHGSEDGITSCGRFSLLPGAKSAMPDGLIPWTVVEDQAQSLLSLGRIADEWYPMIDYVCPAPPCGETQLLLQFDFSLLQRVVVVGGDSRRSA